MISEGMKQVAPKVKNKSWAEKAVAIRKMRGKYKHLDLMNALIESRIQDRQSSVEARRLAS